MVINIPTIQPFTYQASTAFQERVQLANKINEIIDGINSIGEIPDLQAEIDTINSTIAQIQADIANTDTEVSGIQSQVNTLIQEVNGLLAEVVNEIVVDSPGYGQVRVKLIHEDESETASNALQIPVIQDGGITLISGTTDRSFKIQYITMDGVTHTTNDFVIPEGGGTDVTITSISILQGDTPNDIKFQVGLSDGSTIQSNSYPIPQAAITPATTSQIGGIKVGTNLSVTADGTLSVDMTTIGTAAEAASIRWTADASKVTLHADSLSGSEFTKDIPQASQGGAGTIDAAAYQKLQNVPAPDTIATDSEISDLQEQITGLKLSKPDANQIQLNGDNVSVVESVSGSVDDDGNLVITVNGVSGAGIPLPDPERMALTINASVNNDLLLSFPSQSLSQISGDPPFSGFRTATGGEDSSIELSPGMLYKRKGGLNFVKNGSKENLIVENYYTRSYNTSYYTNASEITLVPSLTSAITATAIPDGNYRFYFPTALQTRIVSYYIFNMDAELTNRPYLDITISEGNLTVGTLHFPANSIVANRASIGDTTSGGYPSYVSITLDPCYLERLN